MYFEKLDADILAELVKKPDVSADESEELNYYVQMGDKLRQRLRTTVDNPAHFEKVKWFVDYWNSIVSANPVQGLNPVEGQD
jgi:hypothetical protein